MVRNMNLKHIEQPTTLPRSVRRRHVDVKPGSGRGQPLLHGVISALVNVNTFLRVNSLPGRAAVGHFRPVGPRPLDLDANQGVEDGQDEEGKGVHDYEVEGVDVDPDVCLVHPQAGGHHVGLAAVVCCVAQSA